MNKIILLKLIKRGKLEQKISWSLFTISSALAVGSFIFMIAFIAIYFSGTHDYAFLIATLNCFFNCVAFVFSTINSKMALDHSTYHLDINIKNLEDVEKFELENKIEL